MIAAALLAASLAAAAPTPPDAARLERRLASSPAARRLSLAAAEAPRREARDSGLPFAIDERGGAKPEIILDLARLRELPPGEAEAEYARALVRASIAAPLETVEGEQAVRLRTAQILVELSLEDAELSRALRGAEKAPPSAGKALREAAAFLAAFERRPEDAYWLVESAAPGRVRLTDLEDFFALRGAELRSLPSPPDGPYAELAGRRYPAAFVKAAYRLRAPGELERLRESLGAYDTVGATALRGLIARWRRAAPPPLAKRLSE